MAKDILKEAIADAKAVREVALANAKAALEEAFTPKLQNMLNAKLSEELDEEYYEDDKELDLGEIMYDEDEKGMDEMNMYDEDEKGMDEMDMYDEDEKGMDEEIDLEEILNELELEEGDANDEVISEKDDDKKEDIEEEFNLDALLNEINKLDDSTKVSTKVNKNKKRAYAPNKNSLKENFPQPQKSPKRFTNNRNKAVNNNFGCRDKINELNEVKTKLEKTQNAYKTVQSELNEVNLLNSKLLYVNRIFKANNLDDGQKMRVVETLDKADSTKEAKLIYETIKDTFKVANNKVSNKKQTNTIKENFKGLASKAAGMSRTKTTAPKKAIISEADNMVNRFQKLANIKMNK